MPAPAEGSIPGVAGMAGAGWAEIEQELGQFEGSEGVVPSELMWRRNPARNTELEPPGDFGARPLRDPLMRKAPACTDAAGLDRHPRPGAPSGSEAEVKVHS